jgi:hypothetical protein
LCYSDVLIGSNHHFRLLWFFFYLIARYNHQRQSRRHHHITINKLFNFGIAKTTIGTRLNEAYKTIKEVKYRSKNNRCIFCGLKILFVCNKKKGNCFYLNEKKFKKCMYLLKHFVYQLKRYYLGRQVTRSEFHWKRVVSACTIDTVLLRTETNETSRVLDVERVGKLVSPNLEVVFLSRMFIRRKKNNDILFFATRT